MGITFNISERALRDALQDAVQGRADKYNEMLASLGRRYRGRPVDEIKPVLRQEWEGISDGSSLSDPKLTAFAEAISGGTPVRLTYDRSR